jgi:sugar-specific transcriptional regulator TrmB
MERSCSEVIRRMDRTVEDKLSNFAEKLKKIERSCNKYEKELLTCIVDPGKNNSDKTIRETSLTIL